MSHKNLWGPPQKFVVQKHQILDHFFCDFCTRHRISSELNEALSNKNASVNLQGDLLSVTFDPEAADATFGGHYVATIKVATSLVVL